MINCLSIFNQVDVAEGLDILTPAWAAYDNNMLPRPVSFYVLINLEEQLVAELGRISGHGNLKYH